MTTRDHPTIGRGDGALARLLVDLAKDLGEVLEPKYLRLADDSPALPTHRILVRDRVTKRALTRGEQERKEAEQALEEAERASFESDKPTPRKGLDKGDDTGLGGLGS